MVWRSATATTRLRSAGTRPASSPTPRSQDYYPNAITGSRAPHAWLAADRSILDLFGRGFTLLRFGDAAPEVSAIERGFAARGVPLTVERISDPEIAALYERHLVLVRPDGHVAWRGDQLPPDLLAFVDRVRGAAA